MWAWIAASGSSQGGPSLPRLLLLLPPSRLSAVWWMGGHRGFKGRPPFSQLTLLGHLCKQGFRGFKGEKGEPGQPGLDGLDAPCQLVRYFSSSSTFLPHACRSPAAITDRAKACVSRAPQPRHDRTSS